MGWSAGAEGAVRPGRGRTAWWARSALTSQVLARSPVANGPKAAPRPATGGHRPGRAVYATADSWTGAPQVTISLRPAVPESSPTGHSDSPMTRRSANSARTDPDGRTAVPDGEIRKTR